MTAAPIRVLIVDDHPLVREGLRHILVPPGFEVVGEAGDGTEAIALTASHGPDVVVLDINLPDRTGLEVIGALKRQRAGVKILMLSVHDHPEYVLESVRSGAHGYLRKDSLPEELREAIRVVHRGETHFAAASADRREPAAPMLAAATAHRLELLTRRERDVLVGVASGKTNKEIAADLGLSVRTVESYRETLVRKLGIPTTAGLTRFALEARLLGS
jgi:DNA-binding NarL/FixJ family response regulator